MCNTNNTKTIPVSSGQTGCVTRLVSAFQRKPNWNTFMYFKSVIYDEIIMCSNLSIILSPLY